MTRDLMYNVFFFLSHLFFNVIHLDIIIIRDSNFFPTYALGNVQYMYTMYMSYHNIIRIYMYILHIQCIIHVYSTCMI